MREYEALMIVVPQVGEEELQETAKKFASMVEESGGTVQVLRSLGKRTLAYRIGPYEEGIYVLMQFSCAPSLVDVLRREMRLSEQVVRALIVRHEEGTPLEEGPARERERAEEIVPEEAAGEAEEPPEEYVGAPEERVPEEETTTPETPAGEEQEAGTEESSTGDVISEAEEKDAE